MKRCVCPQPPLSARAGLHEYDGILFDLDAGTFTSTVLGVTATRPLSPAILAKMREIGFAAWAATTREGRVLEQGRKHGGN
jgi:hypothetical protein